jgi:hypothetical protein
LESSIRCFLSLLMSLGAYTLGHETVSIWVFVNAGDEMMDDDTTVALCRTFAQAQKVGTPMRGAAPRPSCVSSPSTRGFRGAPLPSTLSATKTRPRRRLGGLLSAIVKEPQADNRSPARTTPDTVAAERSLTLTKLRRGGGRRKSSSCRCLWASVGSDKWRKYANIPVSAILRLFRGGPGAAAAIGYRTGTATPNQGTHHNPFRALPSSGHGS